MVPATRPHIEPAMPLPTRPAKDTPKSRRTRTRILDQAARLVREIGYANANNAVIAEAAGLTRGAMLYHFPTRESLIEGLVEHLAAQADALFADAARNRAPGADVAEHAIDAYWRLLHTPPLSAMRELRAAARTDAAVRERLAPFIAAFDRAEPESVMALFQPGSTPRGQAGRDLARFLLEGLANADLTYNSEVRAQRLIGMLKRIVRVLNRKGEVSDIWPD
jgi:AcrR family transcriptional regulator